MKAEARSQESGVRSQKQDSGFWILTSPRPAFTLIELLVVITIIAILSALVVGSSKYAWRKAATSRAQAEIASLEGALENYKIDTGRYPVSTSTRLCPTCASNNSASLYQALTSVSGKTYFPFKPAQIKGNGIVDPFGGFYNYYCRYPADASQTNKASFDLWSYGPDAVNNDGANDDITNWRQ